MKMLDEDLKNMFSEIYDESAGEYLQGLFKYGSDSTAAGKHRIDFAKLGDKASDKDKVSL